MINPRHQKWKGLEQTLAKTAALAALEADPQAAMARTSGRTSSASAAMITWFSIAAGAESAIAGAGKIIRLVFFFLLFFLAVLLAFGTNNAGIGNFVLTTATASAVINAVNSH